jgi:hypothetical protein
MLMGRIARYSKTAAERKRYTIDYTDWLDPGENVSGAVFDVVVQTLVPLVVDDIEVLPSGLGVQYYISGGTPDITYEVSVTMTTSQTQIREDGIIVSVKDLP